MADEPVQAQDPKPTSPTDVVMENAEENYDLEEEYDEEDVQEVCNNKVRV